VSELFLLAYRYSQKRAEILCGAEKFVACAKP
jgi:hypothetical protein